VAPWRVDVEARPGVARVVAAAALARVVASALDAAGAPAPGSIGLILADDRELAALNRQHMGVAGPTDVLSFPLFPPDAYPDHPGRSVGQATSSPPGAHALLPGTHALPPGAFVLPPHVRAHLGDVVVSVERAIAQAEAGRGGQTGDVRWSAADELRLLVVHGALHVCGWDHADPIEEAAMRAMERRLLGQ
jgi:probable rRNA maturation factor